MGVGLTEGQLLYLNEQYEQALPKLKEELELSRRLDAKGIGSEIDDPRVHQILIDSLEGEFPSVFRGQAGVLDLIREVIQEQTGVGFELAVVSLLEESSNDGVQFIAEMFRDVLTDGRINTQHTQGIEPYRTAGNTVDNQSLFFVEFGEFLVVLNHPSLPFCTPTEGLQVAIELMSAARAGVAKDTPTHARALGNEGSAYRALAERGKDPIENLEEAIKLYSKARAEFKRGTSDHARTHFNEGIAHQELANRGVNPIEHLEEAIKLYRKARAGPKEGTYAVPTHGQTRMREATAHAKLARHGKDPVENLEEAIKLYRKARANFKEGTSSHAGTSMGEGIARQELAKRGKDPVENLEEAIRLYSKARSEFKTDTSDHRARTQMSEGIARQMLAERGKDPEGNFEEAAKLHRKARAGFEEDTSNYARTRMNEANIYQLLAEYGKDSVENLEKAIELLRKARSGFEEDTRGHALTQMNEAVAHQELAKQGIDTIEKLKEAIELYEHARGGLEEGKPSHARTRTNEANVRQLLAEFGKDPVENLEEVIELSRKAREGFKEGKPSHAKSLISEANARQRLAEKGVEPIENLTEAIKLYERARAGFEEGMPDHAVTLLNEGHACQRLAEQDHNAGKNYAEAEALYTEAREVLDTSANYDALRQVNENLAALYHSRGNLEEAYESYTGAIEAIEAMRETVRAKDNREEFFEDYVQTYHETVLLALALDKPAEAFEYAERAKGRIFLDMLADTQVTGDIPDNLADDEQQLKERIAQLRRDLGRDGRGIADASSPVPAGTAAMPAGINVPNRATTHTLGEQSSAFPQATRTSSVVGVVEQMNETVEEKKQELKEAKQELDEVQTKIREQHPEAFTLRSVDVASLEEIQDRFAPDEHLLEYFITDEEIVIFLIDKHDLTTETVEIEENSTADSLAELTAEYRTLVGSEHKGEVSRWQDLGEQLYDLLIAPVEEQLGNETLTIVPHGCLHVVPFAALYDGERYLVEQYRLRFVANASTLRFIDEPEESEPADALVVGDPREQPDDPDLEHARKEAETVADLYDAEPLIGPGATKADVTQRIETADLAHLACHAQYDSDSPEYSSVELADTELLLDELFELEVGGELVTLAACETAYGEVSRGDEIQTLTRGFQYAGASAVIGTLWRVADELTPEFFRQFYTADGDRAERLRQAQLSFIQADDQRAHPYFWSGFQLYGVS